MKLVLQQLPNTIEGIYGPKKNVMPSRALFLHPDAAKSLLAIEAVNKLRYSDIFRSAEASLVALQNKTGVQPPGYSAHNYGLAVDVDVEGVLKRYRWDYIDLTVFMEKHGWYCHRRDGKVLRESWHFNYLGAQAAQILSQVDKNNAVTWSRAVEARIQEFYGDQLTLDVAATQRALKKLGLYSGDADGKAGPLTKTACEAFARAWKLKNTDVFTPRFQRLLAYVSAEVTILG